tara:strand:+ start:1444 stop:3069 length:1626 start_codon:yes stop_codon:yes gene_type:complete
LILKKSYLLELQNLNLIISNSLILNNISFVLKKNEILGIVGESGSGKSITAFSILNLINSSKIKKSGKIFFENFRIDNLSTKELEKIRGKEISIVFQEPMSSLNPTMKCGKQIEEIVSKHSFLKGTKIKDRVNELLRMVQLSKEANLYNKYPFQLSGGQQQRLMIAIAIACDPKILIADEPTTSLDSVLKHEIIELLKRIQKQTNMSIIFVSHDLSLVSEFTDKTVVLYKGEVVEFGKSSRILANPKHTYTKMLLGSRIPKNKRPYRLPTIENKLKQFANISKTERKKKHKHLYESLPILEINKLSFSYLNNSILKSISFNLYEGEILGLVGESGSGKSTISKCILGINQNYTGEILYNGLNVKSIDNKNFRRNVQLIFQDPYSSLNPKMTIGDSIMEPMIVHNISNKKNRKSKIFKLLEDVGLNKEDFDKYPNQFSGGQRQRIVIARALALKPKVIVCDESVSALDVSIQSQIINLLNNLKEKYLITFLFISHDLSVIKYMTDRLIVLNKGKIEEIDETDSIFNDPKKSYTKLLLTSSGF